MHESDRRPANFSDRLARAEGRIEDHDSVLNKISASLDGFLKRVDSLERKVVVIGVVLVLNTQGGQKFITQLVSHL